MTLQSTLIRRTDGKKFKVVDLAHWSTIAAEDGEQDSVKWYGDGYVSADKGLIRRTDGKKFKVVDLAHWSTIAAEDGEQDSVKWYGDGYVSADKGFSYVVLKCAHIVDNYTNETCGRDAPCQVHK